MWLRKWIRFSNQSWHKFNLKFHHKFHHSAEDNVVSAANKAHRMLFYLKRSFAALTPSIFLPLYKTFIRPHLEYSIQATHPILCRDAEALETVQKLALKFVKGLRHVPYDAALKKLRIFSLTHRRIRGELIAMFNITHDLLKFPMASTFVYPTHQGLRGHAFKFHQQRCCTRRPQFAFTIRAVPFWRKLSAEIVNASSVKSFKALLDAHGQLLFPEVPIYPTPSHNPFPQHTSTHAKTHTLMTLPICPHRPLVVYSNPYCSVDQ